MAAAPSGAQRKKERGSTLTEAAFVTFPFFLLIFGIMEMGFLFRNYLTVGNSAAEAARSASVYGSDPYADFQILQSAKHGIAAMGQDRLERIVIWRASGPGDTVPDLCRTEPNGLATFPSAGTNPPTSKRPKSGVTPPTGAHPSFVDHNLDPSKRECNVYFNGDLELKLFKPAPDDDQRTETFGCTGDAANRDFGWCPQNRFDAVSDLRVAGANEEEGPDYVGIYIQANHTFLTGFFQNETTLTSTKIVRIEPENN